MLLLTVGLLLAGAAVALAARGAALPRIRASERASEIAGYGFSPPAASGRSAPLSAGLERLAQKLGRRVMPSLREDGAEELRTLLMSAGVYGTAPGTFIGYRVLSAIAAVAGWLWLGATVGASPLAAILTAPVAGFAGWALPLAVVRDRAQRRLGEVDFEMPELIDSLVVTVEAGLGFNAALQMAARELSGPLGQEIDFALREQAMGLSPDAALQNMAKRADTPAMRSFVRSVLQGETLGVSIGEIMRALAEEMRARRRSAAEERAQKAPVKLLFPLILLIFPAMLIVLLYPAIVNIGNAFGG